MSEQNALTSNGFEKVWFETRLSVFRKPGQAFARLHSSGSKPGR
ncbi:hypothetical protein SAMN05421642_12423 [Rhodococcoides kyotonense]|uniref:Uncharacterized protein n=1 Tax=Rhodococcoides kyotonense TaxID=398843 RepID=A0A239MWV4_9NOCA|nr:hypothetical protein SAMN05421642_12423 [Rhodococcus kyotonensis]